MPLLSSVLEINAGQPAECCAWCASICRDLAGVRVAVLGIAFKPDTDDVRESPRSRSSAGCASKARVVSAYDPVARPADHPALAGVQLAGSMREALEASGSRGAGDALERIPAAARACCGSWAPRRWWWTGDACSSRRRSGPTKASALTGQAGGAVEGDRVESSAVLRRIGHAAARALGHDPEAAGKRRLPADHLAPDALLRAFRPQGLRAVRWAIAATWFASTSCATRSACPNDFTLSGGGRKVDLHSSDIQDWRITFVDTGLHANIGAAPAGGCASTSKARTFSSPTTPTACRTCRWTRWSTDFRQGQAGGDLRLGASFAELPLRQR